MAPVPIEDWIKKEVPFLSNVMLIGDKRKYVTCLVTIQVREVFLQAVNVEERVVAFDAISTLCSV